MIIHVMIFFAFAFAFFGMSLLPHTPVLAGAMGALYACFLWWANLVNLVILRRGNKRQK